jgi:hypothetical protein
LTHGNLKTSALTSDALLDCTSLTALTINLTS